MDSNSTRRGAYAILLAGCAQLFSPSLAATGTAAGVPVLNSAEASFTIGGVNQPTARASVLFRVDELLEVALTSVDVGPVGVFATQTAAVQQYRLTNLGNGQEAFRLQALDAVPGDDFDPQLATLFIESNGQLGLQTGPGGDDPYVPGGNDPLLAADEALIVYVTADIPAGLADNDVGLMTLRGVARTIVDGAGTSDPTQPAFPVPGTSYSGQGDGGLVVAMVGATYDTGAPQFAASHDFLVTTPTLSISKAVLGVADPGGGTTVVSGSVIDYEISVTLPVGGSATALTVTDPLPVELAYQPASLQVSALPAGEEFDDDFLPAGVDNTGFDPLAQALEVRFGDVVGPVSYSITFQAVVR
ncbi:MAG: hypothetical protein AAF515_02760 [Pseudomonadota bacterium]